MAKIKLNKLLKEIQFHGGNRLAEKNCRWLWAIALLTLFGSAVTVIVITVQRFLENPTFMIRLETVENYMQFPSVLVYPEISFRDDKISRFLGYVKIPPELNETYLRSVIFQLGAFYSPDVLYKIHDLQNLERLLEYNEIDLDTAGRLLTSSCAKTLTRCRWQGEIVNCSSVFRMELTGDGYCCVFNGRSLKRELSGAFDYDQQKKWRTDRFGYESGLMLAVNQSQNPTDVNLSYKWIALQSGQHYVDSSINGTALSRGSEQWMEFHIHNLQIADYARDLSHSLRKCRLANEPLQFFPLYYKKYCVVECEVALTMKRCNCVRLVHPRPRGTPYCSAHQLLCAKHAMVSYDSDQCNCPPACDVATNFVKFSSFQLNPKVKPRDTFYDGLDLEKISVVRTFIGNNKVKTNSRWSYFNNLDLFSQLGGVFNVFFGCSLLSLLELVILTYHFIEIKIHAKMNKNKTRNNPEHAKKCSEKNGKKNKKKLKTKL